MSTAMIHMANEQAAATAFGKQSIVFDDIYADNTIVQYKRQRVRQHVQHQLPAGTSILELNAGTGEDAVYFARQGYKVHATDVSEGMQARLVQKVKLPGLREAVTRELCSYTALANLQAKGPYDAVFSNFAGLNCTGELDKVLLSLAPLVKSGGLVTLVILPPFCLWETLLLFKGKFRTAFRRFLSSKGVTAQVEGIPFKCWYYPVSYVEKHMAVNFTMVDVEGLCTIVPPSYMEYFAERHPRMYKVLKRWENKWRRRWPWKYIGDYYIVSFRKKG